MIYPKEILNSKHEYVRFFIKRFPFDIFNILMKPHLEGKRYNYILKEITEVVGVFNVLKNLINKNKMDKFVLYELMSGDALFSHFVAENFPNSKIVAIDLKFSEDYKSNNKSKFFDNIFFIEKNILEIKDLEKADFIVSIHACNNLSEVVIDKASEFSNFFILVPCCIGSESYEKWKKYNEIANKFFNAINNEYYKWCFYLAEYAKSRNFHINFKVDNKMLTERNLIIFGKKI
ncbi:MAG: hypothetical protein QW678_01075 [Candidatus Aenigmatarchaeota archaeon]